jgi:hypothetical protein
MPTIDITSPLTGAINGANSAATGIVAGQRENRDAQEQAFRQKVAGQRESRDAQEQAFRQKLARDNFDLLKQHQAAQQALAQTQAEQRRVEIERLSQERAGRGAAVEGYYGIRGRQFSPKESLYSDGGASSFFGDRSRNTDDPAKQVESYLGEQRQSILKGAPQEPNARRLYLETFLPLMEEDENNERQGVAIKQQMDWGKEALQSGMLEPDEQQVLQEGMQALSTGAEKPEHFDQMLQHLRETAKARLKKQMNLQSGDAIFQKVYGEAQAAGGDLAGYNDAYADWLTDQKGGHDPKVLDLRLQEQRLGVKIGKIKIGDVEISKRDMTPWKFKAVASAQAQRAAIQDLAHDPEIATLLKAATKAGAWSPASQAVYDKKLRAAKRARLEQYAAQADLPQEAVDFLFPPEQQRVPSADEIRAALKAGNVDLDKIGGQAPGPAPYSANTGYAHDSGSDITPTPNDPNADGVVDEKDLEAIYPKK